MAINSGQLPAHIRNSEVLSQDSLEHLASTTKPNTEDVEAFASEPEVSAILEYFSYDQEKQQEELHKLAQEYIDQGQMEEAWKTLLQV